MLGILLGMMDTWKAIHKTWPREGPQGPARRMCIKRVMIIKEKHVVGMILSLLHPSSSWAHLFLRPPLLILIIHCLLEPCDSSSYQWRCYKIIASIFFLFLSQYHKTIPTHKCYIVLFLSSYNTYYIVLLVTGSNLEGKAGFAFGDLEHLLVAGLVWSSCDVFYNEI